MKYKRILLKLSGEVLAGEKHHGIDFDKTLELANEIKECTDLGYEIGIVVGGGNFWRGKSNEYMDRATSDYIGMMGTVMNALALGDAFKQLNVDVRVQTGVEMRQIAEFYIKDRAIRHLEKGRVVIFGCGTGSPFFSTDTASALRAAEIKADVLIKATKVNGVYDKDPKKYNDAVKFDKITYIDVLNKKLKSSGYVGLMNIRGDQGNDDERSYARCCTCIVDGRTCVQHGKCIGSKQGNGQTHIGCITFFNYFGSNRIRSWYRLSVAKRMVYLQPCCQRCMLRN